MKKLNRRILLATLMRNPQATPDEAYDMRAIFFLNTLYNARGAVDVVTERLFGLRAQEFREGFFYSTNPAKKFMEDLFFIEAPKSPLNVRFSTLLSSMLPSAEELSKKLAVDFNGEMVQDFSTEFYYSGLFSQAATAINLQPEQGSWLIRHTGFPVRSIVGLRDYIFNQALRKH